MPGLAHKEKENMGDLLVLRRIQLQHCSTVNWQQQGLR